MLGKLGRYGLVIFAFAAVVKAGYADSYEVKFLTDDNVTIAATVSEPDHHHDHVAAVIFVHQGGSSKDEWRSLELFDQVVESGMLALAYEVRGHGESSGKADFSTLFNDPLQAPKDLAAAIDWLEETGRVDMSRIAVVGASIGANLACVAAGNPNFAVKTAVAISGKVSAVINLSGGKGSLPGLQSVFLIAGELEQNGQRAGWARKLYGMTAEPHRLEIVKGSSAHGVSVFDDSPGLQQRVLDWLIETL